MPAIPANYDSVSMTVHLDELQAAAQTVVGQCTIIGDFLTAINNNLGALALSWTGPGTGAAAAAQAATTRWNNVTSALYGTQIDPGAGILNIMAGGVSGAVSNYANNEWGISNMFAQFYNAATGSPSSGNSTPPDISQYVIDGPPGPAGSSSLYHFTSVNETDGPLSS